jgi:WD40 repeat protein
VSIEGDGGLVITGAGLHSVQLRPGSYRLLAAKDGKPMRDELITVTRGDKQVVKVSLDTTGQSRALASFQFTPPPPGPLDKLDPARIPAEERFDWQPKDLVAVLGEHRQRHWARIQSVAWSADGTRIVSGGGGDCVIRVWDAHTLRERAVLRGHKHVVLSVAVSRDGRHVLSGSWDKTVRWWHAQTGEPRRRFDVPAQVYCVALSPDGRHFLSGDAGNVLRLWDVETGQELRRFRGHSAPVHSVAFSPDGRRALSGGHDHTVRLWDVAGGEQLRRLEGHTGAVSAVAFSPDGCLALSANDCQGDGSNQPAPDYQLRLWDLDSGQEVRRFVGHAHPVRGLAVSPDGRRVLSCGADATIRSWEVETGKELARFEGHAGPVMGVAFSADGRRAVSGGVDGTVRLWDTAAGKEVQPLAGPPCRAWKVTFVADGTHVLAAGSDGVVRVWDVARGKETSRFQGHTDGVASLALSPDGRRALSNSYVDDWHVPQPDDGDRTGSWRLWDVASGKELRRLAAPPMGWGAAFSPDGRRALTGCREQVLVWDVDSGRQLRSLDGHTGFVTSVAFSPDGDRALSGSWDCTVRLWDVGRGTQLRCVKGHTRPIRGVAFSPDGRQAVSGSEDGMLRLWDLGADGAQGQLLFKGHTNEVMSVAFGPDGKELASAGVDGRVILWDVAAADKIREWQLPGAVNDVAFARDGRHLATANGNGTVYVLRLAKP